MNYLAKKELLPVVKLYKDVDVETKDVDMVIDIGNSRTTALLVEDNTNFNQVILVFLTFVLSTMLNKANILSLSEK